MTSEPRKPLDPDLSVSLPAERFYWALLDASSIPRNAPLLPSRTDTEARLGYLFESLLPISIDAIHAAYLTLDRTTTIACGLPKEELQHHLDRGATTLVPASLPSFLEARPVFPLSRLNLLTAPFEPPAVRRARSHWLALSLAVLALVTVLLCIGLERRSAAEHRAASAAEAAIVAVYDQILPKATGAAQPNAARLLGELRMLRQTRGPAPSTVMPDAGASLSILLGHWPASTGARVESLVVTPSAITLIASVADHQSAQSLASAVGAMQGWRTEQPQVSQAKESVRLTARLVPELPPPQKAPR